MRTPLPRPVRSVELSCRGTCGHMRRYSAGDVVRVREENAAVRWRKPHLRTPGYLFGLVGTIERDCMVRPPRHLPGINDEYCNVVLNTHHVYYVIIVSLL